MAQHRFNRSDIDADDDTAVVVVVIVVGVKDNVVVNRCLFLLLLLLLPTVLVPLSIIVYIGLLLSFPGIRVTARRIFGDGRG